jgi:hypothetical protein
LEQVPGSGVPFGWLEPGQVADEEDGVAGADIGADGPVGFAGVEECRQCLADRVKGARGLSDACEMLASWTRMSRLAASASSPCTGAPVAVAVDPRP